MKYAVTVVLVLLMCLAGAAGASDYQVQWKCLNSGGVQAQHSENFGAKLTLAQPVAGICQTGNYKAHLGFWYCVRNYLGVGVLEPPVAGDVIPKAFRLEQNYPNPFNPGTTIEYALPQPGWVTVAVYNVMGEKIVTLVDEYQAAGYYRTMWDGIDDHDRSAPSGIYFYRLETKGTTTTKKMILLK